MRNALLIISYLIISTAHLSAQKSFLQFIVKDNVTDEPIIGAHVFVLNSSYGTISDAAGLVRFELPPEIKERLVISHIAYENYFISWKEYQELDNSRVIYLDSNGLSIDQITIVGKRDKQWKKNYNKFKEAFLGKDKITKNVKIHNPEVLRFHEHDNTLLVTAIDLIEISNNYLGYQIDFLLKELMVSNDGASQYNGYAKFTDISSDQNLKEVTENRVKTFQHSRRNFLSTVINNQNVEDDYELRFLEYKNAEFHTVGSPNLDSILTFDAHTNTYQLWFNNFLDVAIKDLKRYNGAQDSPQDRDFLDVPVSMNRSKKRIVHSQLYKVSPFLALDKYGHILNENSVKEYGFWAEQRIAHLLPWDFAVDFSKGQESLLSLKLSSFKTLLYGTALEKEKMLSEIKSSWDDAYIPLLLEVIRMSGDNVLTHGLQDLINDKNGVGSKGSFYTSLEKLWKAPANYPEFYGDFKAEIYQHIDPKFLTYFKERQNSATIRLDEILWGGVLQDGIPPLRFPKMISAETATYLNDGDIVFGFSFKGETRAYPKRILAWHEFFVDSFGDIDIAGVFCTLCGTVIAYDMTYNGIRHDLGTSGFLYRSNKLMYDKATQSLWNTVEGAPVMGPLVGQGIQLEAYPLVTTTWGAWKKLHPDTEVLSLDTGYDRNYDEGNAYNEYYATDNLMFPVPIIDKSLANKEEVFVVRVDKYRDFPTVFSSSYLKSNPIVHEKLAETHLTILTDPSGASRAYATETHRFDFFDDMRVKDSRGNTWTVDEQGIHSAEGVSLKRLAAHEIFWFAWVNSYPNTKLYK